MKLRAAYTLAELVKHPTKENLLPDPLDAMTLEAVAAAVDEAAHATGVAAVRDQLRYPRIHPTAR